SRTTLSPCGCTMRAGGLRLPTRSRGMRGSVACVPVTSRVLDGAEFFDWLVRGVQEIAEVERMTIISPRPLSPAGRRERAQPLPAPREARLALYRAMLKIRRVEERIQALYPQGDMRCPTHFSIGQEAVAAGICRNLQLEDHVISAHRSHAHYIGKGGNLRAMFAELYGKATGCASGKGGSMHLIDLSVNFLGCVPIVGSTIPIGVGAAF